MFFKKNKPAATPELLNQQPPSQPVASQGQSLFAPGINPAPARIDFGFGSIQPAHTQEVPSSSPFWGASENTALPAQSWEPMPSNPMETSMPETGQSLAATSTDTPSEVQWDASQHFEPLWDSPESTEPTQFTTDTPALSPGEWELTSGGNNETNPAYLGETFENYTPPSFAPEPQTTDPLATVSLTQDIETAEAYSAQPANTSMDWSQYGEPATETESASFESMPGFADSLSSERLPSALLDDFGTTYNADDFNVETPLSIDLSSAEAFSQAAEPLQFSTPDLNMDFGATQPPPTESATGDDFWTPLDTPGTLGMPEIQAGESINLNPGAFLDSVSEQLYPPDPFSSGHTDFSEMSAADPLADIEAGELAFEEAAQYLFPETMSAQLDWSGEQDSEPLGTFNFSANTDIGMPTLPDTLDLGSSFQVDGDNISEMNAALEAVEFNPPESLYPTPQPTPQPYTPGLEEPLTPADEIGQAYSDPHFVPEAGFEVASVQQDPYIPNSEASNSQSFNANLESEPQTPSTYTDYTSQGNELDDESTVNTFALEVPEYVSIPSGAENAEPIWSPEPLDLNQPPAPETSEPSATPSMPRPIIIPNMDSTGDDDEDFYAVSFTVDEQGQLIPLHEEGPNESPLRDFNETEAMSASATPQPEPPQAPVPAPELLAAESFVPAEIPPTPPTPIVPAPQQPLALGRPLPKPVIHAKPSAPKAPAPIQPAASLDNIFHEDPVYNAPSLPQAPAPDESNTSGFSSFQVDEDLLPAPPRQAPAIQQPLIQQPMAQPKPFPAAPAQPPVTPHTENPIALEKPAPSSLEEQWEVIPAKAYEAPPPAPAAPPELKAEDLMMGNLEILGLCPLSVEQRLLLVHNSGIFALMGQYGSEQPKIYVLKRFEHNPIAYQNTFTAAAEGQTGNQGMYVVQVGTWHAIISTFQDTISLHTELG